jgi:anthranilate/para-aminobenzoate synthase component II
MPSPFNATRYHSLVGVKKSLPKELIVSAWTKEGEIMGVRHREFKMEGVQYHPESILTEGGKLLLKNFLTWK